MRVALRCRLPGPLRQGHDAALLALLRPRKHHSPHTGRIPRVVVRVKFPEFPLRARDWIRPGAEHVTGPWHAHPRIAVLAPWFGVDGGARVFWGVPAHALRHYRPGALAGPVPELRWLAETFLEGNVELPSLEFGVLAFTGTARPRLTEADRELFWRAFQVPVFEQYRGAHGELLAAECEAHHGLHVIRDAVLAELNGVEILHEPCPCGAGTPRAVSNLLRTAVAQAAGGHR